MDEDASEIRQGFICPICLKDLCDSTALAKHFQNDHSNDKAVDNDAIFIVKGMFLFVERVLYKYKFFQMHWGKQNRKF